MECLENLVGIKGLCESEDFACIYVDDLPFGELKSWAQIAGTDFETGKNLFQIIRKEAVRLVIRDFLKKIKGLEFQHVKDTFSDGDFNFDTDPVTGVHWKDIRSNVSDPYMSVSIPSIEICAKNEGKITVVITDKTDCVTTKVIDVHCGINSIPINYKGDSVKISIDTGNVEIFPIQDNFYCHCQYKCPCYVSTASSNTVPFRTYINCICDPRQLACQYADELKYAIRYRIMAELMRYSKLGDPKNLFLRGTADQAASYYADIMGGTDPITGDAVKGPLYYVELSCSVGKVNPRHSRCLQCGNKGTVYREGI